MNKPNGYSRLQIALHWLVAVLILFQILFHEGMEDAYEAISKGQPVTGNGAQIHIIAGVAVLIFGLLRLIERIRRGAPEGPAGVAPLQELAARIVHGVLYVLMIVVPASGMAAWFGGVKMAADAHEVLFQGLLVLVVLHVLAALFHQYVLKNGLIRRMMRSG